MKIEIEKLKDEYKLTLDYNNRIEISYIKDLQRLLNYILINMLYDLTGKSEYYNKNYAKLTINYEKDT